MRSDDDSGPSRLTLTELADRVGINPRTIRHYIAQGLLPPPEPRRGPAARYGQRHVDRLSTIQQLKESRHSLDQIRRKINVLSPGAIQAEVERTMRLAESAQESAEEATRWATEAERLAAPEGAPEAGSSGSALDYVRAALGDAAPPTWVASRSRGESWLRIPVTPDVELHARGPVDDGTRRSLERIADHLRELLQRSGASPTDTSEDPETRGAPP